MRPGFLSSLVVLTLALQGCCAFSPLPQLHSARPRFVPAVVPIAATKPAPSRFERLVVKTAASALAASRILASTPPGALSVLSAAATTFIFVITPTLAVEMLLMTALLIAAGAANYWPINIFVLMFGCGGFMGCLHGIITCDLRLPGRKRRLRKRRAERKGSSYDAQQPKYEAFDALFITIGSLAVSVLAALP